MRVRLDLGCAALLLTCWLGLIPGLGAQDKAPGKLPDFGDYPVKEIYQGKHARARIVTAYQKLFQTRIRESMDDDVNFAGHYVVATWGCGSGCMQFAVADAVSGRVYDPPMKSVAFHFGPDADHGPQKYPDMVNVKPDSALMVIEGCPDEGEKCGRFYYHFDHGRFILLHFDPDPPDAPAK
ncbi:MAG TPA: hypothetical protein VE825_18135 [Terriglobales bacterium]|nr:hypothetical protein [Terriglobales bacterium]